MECSVTLGCGDYVTYDYPTPGSYQAVVQELCAWSRWAREEMANKGKFMTGNPATNWEGKNPLLTSPKPRSNAPKQPGSKGLGKSKMRKMNVVGKRGR